MRCCQRPKVGGTTLIKPAFTVYHKDRLDILFCHKQIVHVFAVKLFRWNAKLFRSNNWFDLMTDLLCIFPFESVKNLEVVWSNETNNLCLKNSVMRKNSLPTTRPPRRINSNVLCYVAQSWLWVQHTTPVKHVYDCVIPMTNGIWIWDLDFQMQRTYMYMWDCQRINDDS